MDEFSNNSIWPIEIEISFVSVEIGSKVAVNVNVFFRNIFTTVVSK